MTGSTRRGRILTWVLALAVALVSSLTCLVGIAAAAEKQACCATMNHDCGAAGTAQDCCVIQSPNSPGVLFRSPVSLALPPLVAMDTTAIDLRYTAKVLVRFAIHVPISSRPTYLVDSVFRL